jgi:hypothetical protein
MNGSVSGKKYELEVFNIVKNCTLNGVKFNSQNEKELGGSSARNDIECNMTRERDVCIEIKILPIGCNVHYIMTRNGQAVRKTRYQMSLNKYSRIFYTISHFKRRSRRVGVF